AAYGSTPGPATMRRSNNATAWTTLDRYRSAAPGRYLRRPPPLLPARRGPSATDPGDGGQVCPMPTQPDIDEVVARYGRDELGAGAAVAALREALPSVLVDTATSRLLTPRPAPAPPGRGAGRGRGAGGGARCRRLPPPRHPAAGRCLPQPRRAGDPRG